MYNLKQERFKILVIHFMIDKISNVDHTLVPGIQPSSAILGKMKW